MGQLILSNLKMAYLNLLRNRRRTIMSVAIVAIALYAVNSAGGFGLYTYESLEESSARDVGHFTLTKPGYFDLSEEVPLANGIEWPEQVINKLNAKSEVRAALPRIEFTGLLSNGQTSTIFMGIGVSHQEFDVKGPFLKIVDGRSLSDINSPRYDATTPEVMLGKGLAQNLNVRTGDWLTILSTTTDGVLNALDYRVRGIFETGVPEVDKRQLFVHISEAKNLLVSEKVSLVSIYLNDHKGQPAIEQWLNDNLAKYSQDQDLDYTPWQERAFYFENVKNLYDRIFGMLGIVLGLVIFVSIFSTLTMSVTERTREIGTLSAIGAYSHEIVRGFLLEASLIGIIGGLLSGLLTVTTSLVLFFAEVQMPPPPGGTEGYPLYVYFSPLLWLTTSFIVLSICVFSAWLAARKGVNQPITEALAHV